MRSVMMGKIVHFCANCLSIIVVCGCVWAVAIIIIKKLATYGKKNYKLN